MKNAFPFEPNTAHPAHAGTILASDVLPKDFPAPFGHAWGYLDHPARMDKHVHPAKEELFTFYRGKGYMELDDKRIAVEPGTVVTVRPGVYHSVINEQDEPLLWAAFWWDTLPDLDPNAENVLPFCPETAHPAHENTILCAPVIQPDFPAPFHHAWGCLMHSGRMDAHSHIGRLELFMFTRGTGFVELDGERIPVAPGTAITVRPEVLHTVINELDEPLLWAAFWWNEIEAK